MTVTLRHAIKISAPRHRVFTALSDTGEVAAWHVGGVDGEIAVGATFKLNPKPGLVFGWRTEELVSDETVRQVCVEGPGNSAGKTLTFYLSENHWGPPLGQLTGGGGPARGPGP